MGSANGQILISPLRLIASGICYGSADRRRPSADSNYLKAQAISHSIKISPRRKSY